MKSNDITQQREQSRIAMQAAIKAGDTEGFYKAFDSMMEVIGEQTFQQYEQQINDLRQEMDSRILTARGVRLLTTEERTYCEKLIQAFGAADPKQALANLDVVMPKTTIDSVFEDLKKNHPLLSHINFIPSGGAVKLFINTNGYQQAAWGQLTDKIVQELTSGFKEVSTTLFKLSAFLPVGKAMLELGPEWLDKYIREVLYEALANGLEVGIVDGDGKDKPIGTTRQVGEGVIVTGGVYPKKNVVALTEITPDSIGGLLSLLAVDANGNSRPVTDVLFIVNHQDYFQKVMPATTLMAPDGSYRNDVMPYPMTIIPSGALARGEAVIGIGKRYAALAGTDKNGKIDFSDHYHFLEDERMYLIKLYANGMPMDDNAFIRLDITGLQPATYKVTQVASTDTVAVSEVATLASLKIGALTLSPVFDSATKAYAAETTNGSNTITAIPSDAGADLAIDVDGVGVSNGTAIEWKAGANKVTIKVTAADGETTDTYTVTVTKS